MFGRRKAAAKAKFTANQPSAGHVLHISYDPESHEAELQIEGDPRYDWKLREAQAQADAARQREQLLNEPPSRDPLR